MLDNSARYLSTTGYLQTISIIADSSSTAQNYWTALSRPGAHGQWATFEVWVAAFGAKLLFYFIVLDRFSCLPQDVYKHRIREERVLIIPSLMAVMQQDVYKHSKFEQSKSSDTLIPSCSEYICSYRIAVFAVFVNILCL